MKKKLVVLLSLVLVMCSLLCGCVSTIYTSAPSESKQKKYIENAETLELKTLWSALDENSAKAKTTYHGNQYRVTLNATNISEDWFEYMYQDDNGIHSIYIYMETEELAKLENGSEVTVIGTVHISGDNASIRHAFVVE